MDRQTFVNTFKLNNLGREPVLIFESRDARLAVDGGMVHTSNTDRTNLSYCMTDRPREKVSGKEVSYVAAGLAIKAAYTDRLYGEGTLTIDGQPTTIYSHEDGFRRPTDMHGQPLK